MKRKHMIILASVAIVLVVIALGLVFLDGDSEGESLAERFESMKEALVDDDVNEEAGEELKDLNNDGKIDEKDEELAKEKEKEEEEDKEDKDKENKEDKEEQAKDENSVKPSSKEITFPYQIPGTNLVIRKMAGYDGVYIEDGSDVDVKGVATILVENTGSSAVEYADISFSHNGKTYNFKVSALPAGKRAAVQEQNKKTYKKGKTANCSASTAVVDQLDMSSQSVKVTDNGDGSLTVKNLTGKNIPAVRVFYKFYMEEESAYIGGITYTAKIENLKSGDSQVIRPSHYDSKASRVMMVRTYDSTN